MPPFSSPLKNDGPACRACGCTQHNACFDETTDSSCGWVKLKEPHSIHGGPLCTACSGTAADLAETVARSNRILSGPGIPRRRADKAHAIGEAALRRYRKRKKEVDAYS